MGEAACSGIWWPPGHRWRCSGSGLFGGPSGCGVRHLLSTLSPRDLTFLASFPPGINVHPTLQTSSCTFLPAVLLLQSPQELSTPQCRHFGTGPHRSWQEPTTPGLPFLPGAHMHFPTAPTPLQSRRAPAAPLWSLLRSPLPPRSSQTASFKIATAYLSPPHS